MALIKCSNCGNDISDKAKVCPKCGCQTGSNKTKTRDKSKKSKKVVFVLLVIMIIGLGIGGLFVFLNNKNNVASNNKSENQGENQEDKLKNEIWEYIKDDIAAALKYPESAEFPSSSEAVIELINGKYTVTGYVNGRAPSGIMVREPFIVYVNVSDSGEITGKSDAIFISEKSYELTMQAYKGKEEKKKNGENMVTGAELDSKLSAVDVTVTGTSIKPKEQMIAATGDFISADIKNNTGNTIQKCVVAYVGWDNNDLPLKLGGMFEDGAYIFPVDYDNVNMKSGAGYGKDKGYYIDESLNVKTVKAIVLSYTTLDGTTWNNPYFSDFYYEYVGKELK